MADITISDLELAPALADDMVFPVENLTDTYAATLAMLRRLLNKTFVEEEDADFNDLTDDGFYQCTGTPTNSPVAGSIVWTLQVSTQGGVTVQRAFSLDDDFANLYIRRWNGVTWTAWLEVGGGALANKANIDASNFNTAGKRLLSGLGASNPAMYENVTLLASNQPYVAPANGYFAISAKAPAAGTYVGFYEGCFAGQYASQANQYIRVTTPLVKRGNSVHLEYTAGITIQSFIFLYADGEG